MKIKCSRCTEEHDISQMEPTFALPDCIAAMLPRERNDRGVLTSKDICCIRKGGNRWFVRALLPIPVQGEAPCKWGLWIELSRPDFTDIVDMWNKAELLQLKRPGRLANELQSYPGSLGLPGIVSFVDMKSIGRFELLHAMGHEQAHVLVHAQRDGVTPARKLEWLLSAIHPEAGSGS